MIGSTEKAMEYIKESQEFAEAENPMSVETLINSQVLSEKLPSSVILQMNTAATMFCQGNIAGAKD
jgi:hypothetical protein